VQILQNLLGVNLAFNHAVKSPKYKVQNFYSNQTSYSYCDMPAPLTFIGFILDLPSSPLSADEAVLPPIIEQSSPF
jgi:hypothetical protein